MANFTERLSELIKSSSMTQKEIADHVGITPKHLRNYLAGIHKPTAEKLTKLAELFSVSIGYLVGVEDEPGQAPPPSAVPIVLTGADRRLLQWIYDDPKGVDLMNELDETEAKRLLALWKVLREVRDKH